MLLVSTEFAKFYIKLYTYHTNIIQSIIALSCVPFFVAPWTGACQAPLYLEIFRQEYLSFCHFQLQGSPQLRDRIHISCTSYIASGFFTTLPPGKPKILSLPWKFPVLDIFTSTTKPSESIFFICVVLHCLECHVADMTYTQRHTMCSLFRLVSFT